MAGSQNPAEREVFLAKISRDDSAIRADVEDLIAAFQDSDSFMERKPAGFVEATIDTGVTESVGTVTESVASLSVAINCCSKSAKEVFGLVFMAEQTEPVRRKVALKIIKPGMDTKEVIARFEAERQALALMDHPNIAKVLDAGTTESGRPYFVMELVKGHTDHGLL